MNLPQVVSREEWLVARKALLAKEKEATKARDALNAARRGLPMVRIDKDYAFEGPDGTASLPDLFEGRGQLIVYHFMFGPDWEAGCPSCSRFVDDIGHLAHLHARDVTLAVVSRAPLARLEPFKKRMGWTFPWYSAGDGAFNYDFRVSFDETKAPLEYNYRTRAEHDQAGTGFYLAGDQPFDLHGVSAFIRDGDTVYHTYSAYARGLDFFGAVTNLLDITALGRQEEWEKPAGRATELAAPAGSPMVRYHDEY